ncbi:MAG: hypothetical protein ABIG93_05595 [archaeon]|nr:hypothetical protein [Nanoarchaeota archaeon]
MEEKENNIIKNEDINKGLEVLNFLKRKKEQEKEEHNSQNIVLLERRQVSKENPAIAQLRITFPENNVLDLEDLKKYFLEKEKNFPLIADVHEIRKFRIGNCNFVLEIRSSKLMYTWLEYFINNFQKDFSDKFDFKVEGSWDKYD